MFSFKQTTAYLLAFCALSGGQLLAQSAISRTHSFDTQGILSPYRSTDVATAEAGLLRELFVKPGDEINQGTPIGRLDWETQMAVLREAEVESSSFGSIELARSDVEFQRRRVEVTIPLVNESKASPRELERFQLELRMAEAKFQAQTEAKLLSQARLEKARIAVQERTIKAPHDGIVVEQVRQVGEFVASNNPVLIKLLDTSKLRARFSIPQELADRFRGKKTAEIRLPNNAVVSGDVEFVAPFENSEGSEIELTILIDNPSGTIRYSKCSLVLP
jgi:membrane fusion protein, multidrug efflux system